MTVEVAGERRPLSQGVELSAYRIVQEALSNVLRHAPRARVTVAVAYGPDGVGIRVVNTPPPPGARPAPPSPGAGHGLLGMRERTAMLGGELTAGPTPDGGFEVSATLPAAGGATGFAGRPPTADGPPGGAADEEDRTAGEAREAAGREPGAPTAGPGAPGGGG